MEKPIQIFRSFAEAEEADREYYRSLTPAERIQIVLMLRERYRASNKLANKFQRVCRVIERTDLLTGEQAGHKKAQRVESMVRAATKIVCSLCAFCGFQTVLRGSFSARL